MNSQNNNKPVNGVYQFEARFQPYHGVEDLHFSRGMARIAFSEEREAYHVSLVTVVSRRGGEDKPLTGAALEGWFEANHAEHISSGDKLTMTYISRIGAGSFASPSAPRGVNHYDIHEVFLDDDGSVQSIDGAFSSGKTNGTITFTRTNG